MFCSKDLQFWISFSSISVPKILLVSVQFEKNTDPFPIFATFVCSKVMNIKLLWLAVMNIKLKFQVRSGPLISTVRQGPCGLNPALLRGIPPSVESPLIDLSSSLQ